MSESIPIPSLAAIRAQLALEGDAPQRSFGQHFLTDPALLERIVDGAELAPGEPVLEVGPGPGVLTATLLRRGASVVAVEADPRMVRALRGLIGAPRALTIVEGDALEERPAPPAAARARLAELAGVRPDQLAGRYAFVANLPYQIASSLIVDVFATLPPRRAVLMVQREVADRMRAGPGSAHYGALSVLLGATSTVSELFRLRPGAFWPPPKVESSCIRIEPRADALLRPGEFSALSALVRRSFQERRKTLRNALARESPLGRDALAEAVVRAGVDPESRAERLSVQDFVRLTRELGEAESLGDARV